MVLNKFKRIDVLTIFLFSLITLSVSIKLSLESNIGITYDGYQYLLSAKVLFSSSMGELYQWIREPGYPMFLSMFYNQNFDFSAIILFQSLILAVSIIITFSYFYLHSKNYLMKILYFFSGLLSFVLVYGYSTWILQQFFFVFLTSLHLLLILIIKAKSDNILLVTLLSSLLILITSSWSIILVPASISAVFFSLLSNRVYPIRKFAYMGLVLILPSVVFLGSWNLYKSMEIKKSIRVSADSNFVTDYGKAPITNLVYFAPANLGAILGYSHETTPGETQKPAANQLYFSFKNEHGGVTCGVLLNGPSEIMSYLPKLKKAECKKSFININYSKLTNLLQIVLPVFIFISFLGLLIYISKGKVSIIAPYIFPVGAVFPYLLEEYGKSRYGLPFIFLTPFLFITIIFDITSSLFTSVNKKLSK